MVGLVQNDLYKFSHKRSRSWKPIDLGPREYRQRIERVPIQRHTCVDFIAADLAS
jgi:hypothetical protein